MGVLYDAFTELAPPDDEEMKEGYRRYETYLESLLTQVQMEAYALYIRKEGKIRIFDEMSSEEIAALPPEIGPIATRIVEDTDSTMENRRVVALLNQRGKHEVAPDLGTPDA